MDAFLYQTEGRYFGQLPNELLELGVEELESLGCTDIDPVYRGIHFSAKPAALYRTVYCARLFNRLLAPLSSFTAHKAQVLYRRAKEIDWSRLLSWEESFAIFANVGQSKIKHSQYAALRVKDAIVDRFREASGSRPSIDTRTPDMWLSVSLHRNRATLSLDLGGGALHKRGYRQKSVAAPMQECLAAAIIRTTGWDGQGPLHNPCCGSGTLVLEALMEVCKIPAQYLRRDFGFSRLPDFDPELWASIKAECDDAIEPLPPDLLYASDIDEGALEALETNRQSLPGGAQIQILHEDIRQLPAIADATVVINPPYGVRLQQRDLEQFTAEIGDFLKQKCTGSRAFIYFGNRQLLKSVGLRTKRKHILSSGGLDGRLAEYELY